MLDSAAHCERLAVAVRFGYELLNYEVLDIVRDFLFLLGCSFGGFVVPDWFDYLSDLLLESGGFFAAESLLLSRLLLFLLHVFFIQLATFLRDFFFLGRQLFLPAVQSLSLLFET